MKRNLPFLVSAGLVAALCFSLSGCVLEPVKAQATPAPESGGTTGAPAVLGNVGVVDYKELFKHHPDFEKVQALDQQVAQMEEEVNTIVNSDRDSFRKSAGETMRTALEKAKAELEGERAQVEAQLQGLGNSLQAQARAEMERLQADLQNQLRKEMKDLAPQTQAPPPMSDTGSQTMKEYLQDLSLIRTRNLTAKRLELEKAVSAEVTAEQQRLEGVMAQAVDSVAAKYQEEKINLQLKHQISQDDAEKQKIEERLSVISDEVDAAKAAKRQEVASELEKFRERKKAEFDSEMNAYQRSLDLEVQQKLAQKRGELGERVAMPTQQMVKSPEVQAKIRKMEAELQAQMASKKAEIESRMRGEADAAKSRLMARQQEIQARLKATEEELIKTMKERAKYLSKEAKAKLKAAEAKVEKAKQERDQLVKRMSDDINKLVGEVAEKQKVAMVVGPVVYHDEALPDLTELSKVAVMQMKR